MPLADAARRLDVSCGKRPAALPHAHGASPRLSGQTLVRRSDRLLRIANAKERSREPRAASDHRAGRTSLPERRPGARVFAPRQRLMVMRISRNASFSADLHAAAPEMVRVAIIAVRPDSRSACGRVFAAPAGVAVTVSEALVLLYGNRNTRLDRTSSHLTRSAGLPGSNAERRTVAEYVCSVTDRVGIPAARSDRPSMSERFSTGVPHARSHSASRPSSRRIEAHPASGGAVVKPDVAGEGLTTALPGAHQYERRLDEPMTTNESFKRHVFVRQKTKPLTNYPLKPMKGLLQGPAAEPPPASQAARRHAGCSSLLPHVRRGNTGAPQPLRRT